jgi:DNA polymerase-4
MQQPAVQRTIMHIDMDAFYASVEERDHPELRGKPVIVGGNATTRGVVAAANYIARDYGIHSAMPTKTAIKLCPSAVLLPPRIKHYAEISHQIHDIFARFTPLIEPLSLDEAFLDVTDSLNLFGSAEKIGRIIQQTIQKELGLGASIGIAPNKFIAKIASDIDKPHGFVSVKPEETQAFLDPLPVAHIWGVGRVTARSFERANIHTIGELRILTQEQAVAILGKHGGHFWQLANGIDERPVISEHEAKSISHETTFERDIIDPETLSSWLLDLTEQVMRRTRRKGVKGRTIHLRLRFSDFTTITRSKTLNQSTDITKVAWETAHDLLQRNLPEGRPIRLIGMGIDGFERSKTKQVELFSAPEQNKQRGVDHVVDDIQSRFGSATIKRGGSLK